MRIPFLAGNWKMHNTVCEALNLVQDLIISTNDVKDREVVVCPTFTALQAVSKLIEGTHIRLGAQNMYCAEKGAFTGEISPPMLKELCCRYVILGHSERRNVFGEDDELINKKIKMALDWGLHPILCVGESLKQREAGETKDWVKGQVEKDLHQLTPSEIEKMVIAYEPIWAIGTGKTDTAQGANDTIGMVRNLIADNSSYEVAQKVRILYGGSVKPGNVDGFMAQKEIDGALVGGAALKADSFARIVKYEEI
ncbi:MAG: triose-phosphate isomerase [Candidatus Eremiobacteraeota bacterium]|nr:triose-phosphate isomerase [Candidatus Eremiobacteraeota bacterium]